jgi:hypothetical protein
VTLVPFIFPRKRVMRLSRFWKAWLFLFIIHQSMKSRMNSLALSLFPWYFSDPSPLSPPSVICLESSLSTQGICLCIWRPIGSTHFIGAKELENGEKSSFGLRLGTPKSDSHLQMSSFFSLDADPMFMK